MTALPAPPPPTIVAAVKAVYPRSPIAVTRVCRVDLLAFVRLRVRGRDAFVALRKARRGWRVVWINGTVARSVPAARRAAVAAQVARLRTRCLAP
jgi:hypothetical protein